MATDGDGLRFFFKYRLLFFALFFFLSVQLFLGFRLLLQDNDNLPGGSQQQIKDRKYKYSYPESWFLHDELGINGVHNKLRSQSIYEEARKRRNEEVFTGKVIISDTGLDNKLLTENNSSLLKLDPETLPFLPSCNITLKESLSAINRAKTSACKGELVNVACEIVNDTLYPKKLPRFCKNKYTTYMRYLGCFKDEPNNRILSDQITLLNDENSPSKCVDLCLQSGFAYAGVQYSVECFCGNNPPRPENEYPVDKCNMKCSSNSNHQLTSTPDPTKPLLNNHNCGGYFAMNVYETGVLTDLESSKKLISLEQISQMKNNTLSNSVRIVYFLTLNGRGVRQVKRLLKTLFQERHYFLIHIDARQDYLYRELFPLTSKLPKNIRFLTKRFSAIWGGASLLQVLLAGMEELVLSKAEWGWDWDYFINLSESDFPLKTTEELATFLSYNRGHNFLKSHGKDVQKFIQKQGLDKTFHECENRMWRLGDRKLPEGVLIDGGSDWIGLHRDFIEYIVNSNDELVNGLKSLFKYTLLPAETFFHTTLKNSEFCSTFIDNNLHVTNWKRKLGCKCQYRHVVDWCGCSPNDFRLSDWNKLQSSQNRLIFFGRKFESVVNQGIINNLERWLHPHQFESHSPTIFRYWQSLYHHKDFKPPEDPLLTLGHSLARLASRIFNYKFLRGDYDGDSSFGNEEIPTVDVNLIEMSTYHQHDDFQGLLIRFENRVDPNTIIPIETWFYISYFKAVEEPSSPKIAKWHSKIRNIRIGSEYDQKEQIFRNWAGILGPLSEPTLAYNVHTDQMLNFSFVWINPIQSIEITQNVSINEGNTANFVKPNLKHPLLPGIWSVKIMTRDGNLISHIKFLVIPLQFYNGGPITSSQARYVNTQTSVEGLNEVESPNEKLISWIDKLVSVIYKVQDICLEREMSQILLSRWPDYSRVKEQQQQQRSRLSVGNGVGINSGELNETPLCSNTEWSSLFPDPKSIIDGIDSRTGRLTP